LENSLGSTPTFDPTGNVLASQAPWVGVVGIPKVYFIKQFLQSLYWKIYYLLS
jgi:hypothetical protein